MGTSYFGLKEQGVEADHPPICIAALKMGWSYSTKLTCLYFVQSPVLKILNLELRISTRLNNKCTR